MQPQNLFAPHTLQGADQRGGKGHCKDTIPSSTKKHPDKFQSHGLLQCPWTLQS